MPRVSNDSLVMNDSRLHFADSRSRNAKTQKYKNENLNKNASLASKRKLLRQKIYFVISHEQSIFSSITMLRGFFVVLRLLTRRLEEMN